MALGEPLSFTGSDDGVPQVEFAWNDNLFEFEFSALNCILPNKNQYAYFLGGVDKDWYYSGENRRGRYSGISPGEYVLRLKGSNNDGLWNEEGISVRVVVNPPPWKTPTAYAAYTFLAAGVMLLSVLFRTQ